jgi:hypothetical protein
MENIIFMKKALEILEELDNNKRSTEYNKIITKIKYYLYENCNHNVIKDLIDIDPDTTREITYCEFCSTTFS